MIVVAVASQKGGSGKTTLSGHLAVEAEKAGAGPVTLIDTDPQGSLSHWWNARAARSPQFAKIGVFDLQSALAHLARTGTKLAIIDTPPAISDSISHVIAHCDLVIVPTRPSPHDLRAVGATADMAERFGKPLIFVVNGATARARITGEAAVALSQHGMVAPVTIHHRVDFAASMVDGRTVGEAVPKSISAKEIGDLWLYVQDRLARLTKDATLVPEFRPNHFSLAPLTAVDAMKSPESEDGDILEARIVGEVPLADRFYFDGPERRSGEDRRESPRADTPHDGPERRSGMDRRASPRVFAGAERRGSVFGRRHTDRFESDGGK